MSLLDAFKKIKCFGFDVDGVLTDASLLLLDDGEMVRSMNTKDGYILKLAVNLGYHIIIISGGGNEGVKNRLHKLGIDEVHINAVNKLELLKAFTSSRNIAPEEVLFMGDDIPDYEAMQFSGLPCCPADAVAEIKAIAKYVARLEGGRGCVREVMEKVLKLNGQWKLDTTVASK